MFADVLKEPEIELGAGRRHIDPRAGIIHFGPLDAGTRPAIRVGLIGSAETTEKLERWLKRCASGLEAKESRQPNLFPRFPGFSSDSQFQTELVIEERRVRRVPSLELQRIAVNGTVENAVELFIAEMERLDEMGGADVLVCAPPFDLLAALDSRRASIDPSEAGLDEASDESGRRPPYRQDFHDVLKAKAMRFGTPTQMIREETYDSTRRRPRGGERRRELQDEATRAWNFFTALYYKAGGSLWRLVRESVDLMTCYTGVSFYKTLDNERVLASVAQVFNERGEGMIVRGAEALLDKDDRQPHLGREDAYRLLRNAVAAYRREHHTSPARLVLHKTSAFSDEETEGFQAAGADERIAFVDLVWVRRSWTRLFREATYPPLRGTLIGLDERSGLIYLRGSVDHFATYPGMYVPRPLEFARIRGETTVRALAGEMMELSKLNWNNTQFDGGEPISVRAARRVGDILKNIPEGAPFQARFGFFM
jgi:hypothetical protein